MTPIHPVILCGGSGTRLWPSSRKAFPKQFSPLMGSQSLFQQTLLRLSDPMFAKPLVLTNEEFRFLARDQAESVGLLDARVVLEPVGRDTAPAILTAALMLKDTPDALMLVAPSDHLIDDTEAFLDAIRSGANAANAGQLVTFGITPDAPETGYGYLEIPSASHGIDPVNLVRFVEKPDAENAENMIKSGHHLWNAGIFLFRIRDILSAFDEHAADMVAPCKAALEDGTEDIGFLRLDEKAYAGVRAQSIDYAIMEKADAISVVPVDAGWSDLGSWTSLHAALATDGDVVTSGNTTSIDCENTLLRSEDDSIHLVGLGLKDTVAVVMRDAVLVADMKQAQKVKNVVETLRKKSVSQADDYPAFTDRGVGMKHCVLGRVSRLSALWLSRAGF